MLDVPNIIKRDRETYYDAVSGDLTSVWPRRVTALAIAVLITFWTTNPDVEFLGVLVSALSIITGFCFGVQFILVDRNYIAKEKIDNIEDRILQERVKNLSKELFDNIAYFNLLSISGVVVSSILLLKADVEHVNLYFDVIDLRIINNLFSLSLSAFLFFVLVEALCSFWRLLGRINYLFQKIRD